MTVLLKCPICEEEMNTLTSHIIYKHNLSIEEFKDMFPNQKIHNDKRKNDLQLKCPYCEKICKMKNALSSHIKYKHPEIIIEKDENILNEKTSYFCEICKEFKKNLSQHITAKHKDYTWEQYCEKYNHSVTEKTLFTEKHKHSLSQNKKYFYRNTERGQELIKEQSIKFSGHGNIIFAPGVKEKVSNKMIERMSLNQHTNFFKCSYGIKVKFSYNNQKFITRSFEEFKCIYMLLINNIPFEYEKIIINYDCNKKYLLDLSVLINNKINYLEIKGDSDKNLIKYENNTKYNLVKQALLNTNYEFKIVNYNLLCENLNIPKKHNLFFYLVIKEMLDKNICKLQQTFLNRNNCSPSTIKKIDKNFETNKNIKISYRSYNNDIYKD